MAHDAPVTPSRLARALAVACLGAQIVFTLAWVVAPLWQGPHYSVVRHSISDMYARAAPGAAVLILVFTLCGIVTVAFTVVALLPTLEPGALRVIGCVALALSIFGLGDLLSPFERLGCRLADSGCTSAAQVATLGGVLDSAISTIGIVVLIVAAILLGIAVGRAPRWPGQVWPLACYAAAVVVAAALVATGLVPSIGGITERIVALAGAAWIALLAVGAWKAHHKRDVMPHGHQGR